MARLLLATVNGLQAIELRPHNSLGRHPSNTIQLLDKIVSKEHCIVEQRERRHILRDLGSLNGTYVNGERVIGERPLAHGDEIALGATRARFDDGSGPVQPPMSGPGAHVASNPPMSGMSAPQQGGAPPSQAWSGPVASPRGGPPPSSYGAPVPSQAGHQMGSVPTPHQAVPVPGTQAMPHSQMQQPVPSQGQDIQRKGDSRDLPRKPSTLAGTRVDVLDSARAIERQILARSKGFVPFDQVAQDPGQLRLDYERLRLSWELAREIALERDLDQLLSKILRALFKFIRAERGVILLREADGTLQPRAAQRSDGTEAPIEVSSTILNHVIKERAAVLTHDASQDFAASKGKSMILNRISSAMVVPLVHEQDVLGAVWLDSAVLAQFQQKDLEVVTSVANQAAMFIENTLLTRKIEQEIITRERFSRLLSPNVAERVISGKLEVKKGGVRVPSCTVFNSDIRGFTSMSENAPAEEMVEILNEYFEQMVETVFKFEGTLDKFMGDGIMAFWGAPETHEDDAVRGVQCALEQMQVLGKFNRRQIERKSPPLAVGIGIHTGPLVAGYVGSSKALSYTVIGDTANISARLCGIATGGQIIVSEETIAVVGNRFEYEELRPAQLKGKEKPLRIFNILRENS